MNKKMKYDGFLKGVRKLAKRTIGVNPDLISAQSFRRTGAQLFYSAGIALEQIKRFGRWSSDAIFEYLQDLPVTSFAKNILDKVKVT